MDATQDGQQTIRHLVIDRIIHWRFIPALAPLHSSQHAQEPNSAVLADYGSDELAGTETTDGHKAIQAHTIVAYALVISCTDGHSDKVGPMPLGQMLGSLAPDTAVF